MYTSLTLVFSAQLGTALLGSSWCRLGIETLSVSGVHIAIIGVTLYLNMAELTTYIFVSCHRGELMYYMLRVGVVNAGIVLNLSILAFSIPQCYRQSRIPCISNHSNRHYYQSVIHLNGLA